MLFLENDFKMDVTLTRAEVAVMLVSSFMTIISHNMSPNISGATAGCNWHARPRRSNSQIDVKKSASMFIE